MRLHAGWMELSPKQLYVTGGVSRHLPILQILADVHQCKVLSAKSENHSAGRSTRAGRCLFWE